MHTSRSACVATYKTNTAYNHGKYKTMRVTTPKTSCIPLRQQSVQSHMR